MKTIVVAGDLIRDYSLVQSPRPPSHLLEPVPHTLLQESPGGAWYLRDLIGLAAADLDATIVAPPTGMPARRAYTIWTPFPRSRGEKVQVWRVRDFLGCEPSADSSEPVDGDPAEADVLALDDLALDFRARPEAWPRVLRDGKGPGAIVLKHSQPVAEGPLWDTLLDRFADRLTILVPVNALRAREARIQDSLSWDLAIEETALEFEAGASALDLGRCHRVLVQFGAAGVASFVRKPGADRVAFERFLYRPEILENTWSSRHPGRTFGILSILAAAVVRHAADPASYPLFIALGRGLRAVEASHERGGGSGRFEPEAVRAAIGTVYHPPPDPGGRSPAEPAGAYFTAFPHDVLEHRSLRLQPATRSDLLRDLAGTGVEYLSAKSTEIVLRGPERALTAVPRARYGGYLTADRQEIERINAIRALILAYQQNPGDRRPLSIAVFGQPGSGKSFAIKQLASELFPGQQPLEFNLAQWDKPADLHAAFHQVRDACLLGRIPLVFFDEFDSGGLRWLKPFLSPMQDAEFQQGSRVHHLGRAIFVFAGGTCADFQTFDRTRHPDAAVREEFRKVKGPDFVSRLRTHLNIKGPNPGDDDPDWLIRRAILLRTLLERHWPGLLDPGSGLAAVSPSVIRGFLRVERYLHGARSLEMVVSASTPGHRFERAHLPNTTILRSHVSDDFERHVAEGELEMPVIEALAEACHAGWYRVRREDGWDYGSPRDDGRKLHPMMRPYGELSEDDKEKSRITARLTNAKLLEIGKRIVRFTPEDLRRPPGVELSDEERTRLMEIEHDIWLRDHLLQGYEYAPVTNESLRLHRDMVPFRDQLPEDRRLDQAIVEAIPVTLAKRQYKLIGLGARG